MEPEKTFVATIDPAKCSSTYDLITTVDWSEQPPDIFINIAFSKTYPSQLHCFDRTSFHELIKQQTPMANWVPKVGKVLDDIGRGGEPGTERYYKLPTGEYLLADAIFKKLAKGEFSGTQYFDTVQLGTTRLGNLEGQFGISMLHGQAPGYPVFKLVPKGETKVTLKVDFSTLEKLDLQAFFKNLDEETIASWCQLVSQSGDTCKKFVHILKEKWRLQEAQILAYTAILQMRSKCTHSGHIFSLIARTKYKDAQKLILYLIEQDIANRKKYDASLEFVTSLLGGKVGVLWLIDPSVGGVRVLGPKVELELNLLTAHQMVTFMLLNDMSVKARQSGPDCKRASAEEIDFKLGASAMKTGVHYAYGHETVTQVLQTFCGTEKCSKLFMNLFEAYRNFRLTLLAESIVNKILYDPKWISTIITASSEIVKKVLLELRGSAFSWEKEQEALNILFQEAKIVVFVSKKEPTINFEPFYGSLEETVEIPTTYEGRIALLVPFLLMRKHPDVDFELDEERGGSTDEIIQRLMTFSF
jgi:hypothetical protein